MQGRPLSISQLFSACDVRGYCCSIVVTNLRKDLILNFKFKSLESII